MIRTKDQSRAIHIMSHHRTGWDELMQEFEISGPADFSGLHAIKILNDQMRRDDTEFMIAASKGVDGFLFKSRGLLEARFKLQQFIQGIDLPGINQDIGLVE